MERCRERQRNLAGNCPRAGTAATQIASQRNGFRPDDACAEDRTPGAVRSAPTSGACTGFTLGLWFFYGGAPQALCVPTIGGEGYFQSHAPSESALSRHFDAQAVGPLVIGGFRRACALEAHEEIKKEVPKCLKV